MTPARCFPKRFTPLLLLLLLLLLASACPSATSASCADESTQAASLTRARATFEDPFGVLDRSWVDASRLCGGRAPGTMGHDGNGGWWGE